MKKILLPFIALLLFACSSDDDAQPFVLPIVQSFLKVNINGSEHKFDRFFIETETIVEPDYTYVDLHIVASIDGDNTKSIEFNLEQDVPGNDTIYFFYLMNGDSESDTDHAGASFQSNLAINGGRRIIGTFSGTIVNAGNSTTTTLTDGSFDISY